MNSLLNSAKSLALVFQMSIYRRTNKQMMTLTFDMSLFGYLDYGIRRLQNNSPLSVDRCMSVNLIGVRNGLLKFMTVLIPESIIRLATSIW